MFIDIHTHKLSGTPITINNLMAGKHTVPFIADKDALYSIGIHPWYPLSSFYSWDDVVKIARLPQIIAIGECGLDKNTPDSLDIQTAIFKKHIELAGELNKPLIIHCVKAYNELITIKRNTKSSVPWIIHSFNGSGQLLKNLMDENFYFSLGHMLFNPNSGIYKIAPNIPLNRLFLETDESVIPIEEIYDQFSIIHNVDKKVTEEAIYSNFVKCFNKSII